MLGDTTSQGGDDPGRSHAPNITFVDQIEISVLADAHPADVGESGSGALAIDSAGSAAREHARVSRAIDEANDLWGGIGDYSGHVPVSRGIAHEAESRAK